MQLKRDYTTYITAIMPNTATGEIPVYLADPTDSDSGFLLIEPGTVRQESCFYHRRSGNIAYTYGVNRHSPTEHAINSQVLLANSVDYLNYLLDQVNDQTAIYRKSDSHIVIKGGYFYIDGHNIVISDLDTEDALTGKTLTNGATNYVYIQDGDYVITPTPIIADAYWVATISTSIGGVITSITRIRNYGVAAKGATGPVGEQGVPGPTGPRGFQGDTGPAGATGNGISGVTLIDSTGLVDTYRISFTDGSHHDYTVTNGQDGAPGANGAPGLPGSIAAAPAGTAQTVSDNVVPPAGSTFTYSDTELWTKVTYADGTYLLSLATGSTHSSGLAAGRYSFGADNALWSSSPQAGTYNVTTHSIAWASGEVTTGTTGVTTVPDGNIAYVNKENSFEKPVVFQGDTVFLGRTSFPYKNHGSVSGTVYFDQLDSMQQKFTLSGNASIGFKNMVQSAGQFVVIGDGAHTLTFIDPTMSGSVTQKYIVGTGFTNGQVMSSGVHRFSISVFDTGVHLVYMGVSNLF